MEFVFDNFEGIGRLRACLNFKRLTIKINVKLALKTKCGLLIGVVTSLKIS